jgi:hypothetical protein
MPENRFPIELSDVLSKAVSYAPGTGGFQVVDQHRYIQGGVDVHQKVDVICFAAKFKELARLCSRLSVKAVFK